jgi:type I restriction enzyme S subunit
MEEEGIYLMLLQSKGFQIGEIIMNNIPKGYKQTKVGVIPQEWEVVRLGEVAKFYKGKGISKKDITTNGISCIRYGELYTQYNEKITEILSKTKISKNNLFLSKANDILIPASGETAIDLATASCILKDDIGIGGDINIIRSKINGIFLSYYLNTIAKIKIASLAQGVSVIHLYSSHLEKLYILKPPLKEQQKIAEILTTWDSAISKQEELIKEKEKLKKGLMQKLLSAEVRFKEFSDEWEEVKLRQVGMISTGTTPSTKNEEYYKNGEYPWITPTDITENKNIYTSHKLLSEKGLKVGRFIQKNSILVTCIASIGKNAILRVDGSCNQQINAIKVNDSFNTDFSYYLLEYNKSYLIRYAGQGGMMILNKNDFSNLKFNFPSLQEQQKIADVLSIADKEIELLKKELEELKKQKKGLMQKLLTGEVRVKIDKRNKNG